MKPSKKSVDEIIADLPKHEQMVVKRLRALILECLPKATEKNNYGVPFYTRNRMICFIWPPSIANGLLTHDDSRSLSALLFSLHKIIFALRFSEQT